MFVYRLLLTLAAPLVLARFGWDRLRGRTTPSDIAERLGAGPDRPEGPVIWLHSASVGELNAARPLIDALLTRAPEVSLAITCNTPTGRQTVQDWGLDRITVQLAPLDYRWALHRHMTRLKPIALIILENEIWPNRITALARRDKPVAVIAARLSARSQARWQHLGALARHIMRNIAFLSAQDPGSQDRFAQLGLPSDRVGPKLVLKALVRLPPPHAQTLTDYATILPRAETVLAASTHAGEEAQILDAFTIARKPRPDLRLILAPRHPQRSAEIQSLIAATGIPYRVRSQGEDPDAATTIYLADTLGEMSLWYHLAGATFVGGSLVDKGGHTPFEPAFLGSAILHGPYLSNFAAEYAALKAGGGAIQVSDAQALGHALGSLSPDDRATLTQKATDTLGPGDIAQLDRVIDGLAALPGLSCLSSTPKGR
ncbi:3-deoxy-D-manno-octulosonic acid transferase [Actibacterium sp. 188UL27-1]|uniref:3-deoxy-D-manno-octulosonic acid transferase n=1 Tax=Actibacterium sp. 188UL27-1 TaxID=2786961 RepID=UPI0019599864|nr:3-deoxy-D-manno-octulosonic acid transferase [Actibacterium sp. 188UL27-1]MBM7068198.1 3-deoxy-D-manno-octulosonic acid transferase [Actibacterium sp. 188UL27-1]